MTKLPIAVALLVTVLGEPALVHAQPAAGSDHGRWGGGPPFAQEQLHAITTAGEDRGVVLFFERAFPFTNLGSTIVTYVPIYAVKETGPSGSFLMMRILVTGTPMPCPVYYESLDCSGPPIGVPFYIATGLACEGADGNAWSVDPAAEVTTTAVGSIHVVRWNGADAVRVCFQAPGMIPTVAVENLGPFPAFSGRATVVAR